MRTKITAFLVLVGVAAAAVGAQGYLATAMGGAPITSTGGMLNWLEALAVNTALFVGGVGILSWIVS